MSMRPPRVLARSFPLIPAISTAYDSVQLLGFDLYGSLTLIRSLYGFCSSGQSFAAGFLQIPRHRRHPCLWLYPSHCRADSGLSPVRTCARRAHYTKNPTLFQGGIFLEKMVRLNMQNANQRPFGVFYLCIDRYNPNSRGGTGHCPVRQPATCTFPRSTGG